MDNQKIKHKETLLDFVLFDCVMVEWIDSKGITDSWEFIAEIESMPPVQCSSIGFVLESSNQYTTICQTKSDQQVLAQMTIPAVAIKSIKKIGLFFTLLSVRPLS